MVKMKLSELEKLKSAKSKTASSKTDTKKVESPSASKVAPKAKTTGEKATKTTKPAATKIKQPAAKASGIKTSKTVKLKTAPPKIEPTNKAKEQPTPPPVKVAPYKEPKHLKEAREYLSKKDKALAVVIDVVGPCRLVVGTIESPFEALAKAIIYQQLNGKAAATIFGRVKALYGDKQILEPEDILCSTVEQLRAAGCSGSKTKALIDLAEKTKLGVVPSLSEMLEMSDDELIERLTSVRGIGRWTVEMLLIFHLGRPDVMPSTDYGVRQGFARIHKMKELPAPSEIIKKTQHWKPFRSVATWYLYRATEL